MARLFFQRIYLNTISQFKMRGYFALLLFAPGVDAGNGKSKPFVPKETYEREKRQITNRHNDAIKRIQQDDERAIASHKKTIKKFEDEHKEIETEKDDITGKITKLSSEREALNSSHTFCISQTDQLHRNIEAQKQKNAEQQELYEKEVARLAAEEAAHSRGMRDYRQVSMDRAMEQFKKKANRRQPAFSLDPSRPRRLPSYLQAPGRTDW